MISQSKVVFYLGSTEGKTIQFDHEGKPSVLGEYLNENRNNDICLADCGARAVVVVNQDGNLIWKYTSHSSVTKSKPFHPCGIQTDSQSRRILATDLFNHCIHILVQNWQFIRYIDNCDLENPLGLHVVKNGIVFVCVCKMDNVEKIKYSK